MRKQVSALTLYLEYIHFVLSKNVDLFGISKKENRRKGKVSALTLYLEYISSALYVKKCVLVLYLKRKTGGKVKEGKININEMNL